MLDMPKMMDFGATNTCELPTLEELEKWSMETSLEKSTNKLSVTPEIIKTVKADAFAYGKALLADTEIERFMYRVKSDDSIETKVRRHPDLRFQSVFNDILGFRIHADDYPVSIPEYYRVADLRNGKANDDGYRGLHLYYRKSNYHYTIEVQLWCGRDYDFNTWMHECTYKYASAEMTRELRRLYDNGKITSYDDFLREIVNHEQI